jgi:hypothetical protein
MELTIAAARTSYPTEIIKYSNVSKFQHHKIIDIKVSDDFKTVFELWTLL